MNIWAYFAKCTISGVVPKYPDRDAKISNLNSLIQQALDDVEAGRVYEYVNADEAMSDIMGSGA